MIVMMISMIMMFLVKRPSSIFIKTDQGVCGDAKGAEDNPRLEYLYQYVEDKDLNQCDIYDEVCVCREKYTFLDCCVCLSRLNLTLRCVDIYIMMKCVFTNTKSHNFWISASVCLSVTLLQS